MEAMHDWEHGRDRYLSVSAYTIEREIERGSRERERRRGGEIEGIQRERERENNTWVRVLHSEVFQSITKPINQPISQSVSQAINE
jgi:hypothetical protein